MAYVSRGVNVTSCEVFDPVNDDFEPVMIKVPGKISPARLASLARREYGKTCAVRDVSYETRTYRMTLDDFIANAEILED